MLRAITRRARFARALRSHSFAWLWGGQTISALGDGAFYTALGWQILLLTGSATTMGIVLVAGSIPRIAFLLFGGVVADRLPRRLVLLWSDGARALVVLTIAVLGWMRLLQVWHLIGLTLLFGVADAFFYPAYQSLPPQLVPTDDLPSANALSSLTRSLSILIGPAIGAALVAASSPASAFAFDGATFIFSVGCLLALRMPPGDMAMQSETPARYVSHGEVESAHEASVIAQARSLLATFPAPEEEGRAVAAATLATVDVDSIETPVTPHQRRKLREKLRAIPNVARRGLVGVFADIREGLGYVTRSPWLWVTIAVASLLNIGIAPLQVASPKLVHDVYQQGVWLLGALFSANAIGSLLATLAMGQLPRLRHRGLIAYGGLLLGDAALLAFGFPATKSDGAYLPIIAGVAAFCVGAGLGIFEVIWATVMQELVPAEKLGRVVSIDWLGSLSLTPIGLALAGIGADRLGPSETFLMGGALNVTLILLALCVPGVRRLD